MDSVSETLSSALRLHQAGQFQQAELLYRQILDREPTNVAAWHLLGRLADQVGQREGALQCLQQAIYFRPDYADAFNDLGTVLEALGRTDEAASSYRRVIELRPDDADAYFNLGNVLRKQNQDREAESAFRRSLQLKPGLVEAHLNVARMFTEQERLQESMEHFREALALVPRSPNALFGMGFNFQKLGQFKEALSYYDQALQSDPGNFEVLFNRATVLEKVDQIDAIDGYRGVLKLNPRHLGAINNLGLLLWHRGNLSEAATLFRRALEIDPRCADALHNLGIIYGENRQYDEAAACFDRAIQINPNLAQAHLNRAHLWLSLGDFERGWAEYEWRWQTPEMPMRQFDTPRWEGESLQGKTILVYSEQGFGDTLQFVRYGAALKALGANVLFQCQKTLIPLLSSCRHIDHFVPIDERAPPFDFQSPLMSLPRILKTGLQSIPRGVPYLFADAKLIEQWRNKLDTELTCRGLREPRKEFLVGINWHGRGGNRVHQERDIPLAAFASLGTARGVRLVNLQKGHDELAVDHPEIISFGQELDASQRAFMDTAAIITNLDLTITSDTSIPHLAGALGAPVWVALKTAADWRWLVDRDDSPWYPTVRLFRQHQAGDWETVFEKIRQSLTACVEMHGDSEQAISKPFET